MKQIKEPLTKKERIHGITAMVGLVTVILLLGAGIVMVIIRAIV